MVMSMENKYLLVAVIAIAVAAFAVSVASADSNTEDQGWPMMGNGFGDGMMGMMGDNFAHDQDDIDWMREEMKEHMNFTDEEFDEMAGHCPMMRGR